jgi:hypothetical protein
MIIFRARPGCHARVASFACLIGLVSFVPACAEDNALFEVKTSPELRPMTVSVLGVFKEGRMSPDAWDDFGLKVSPAFGKGLCPTEYNNKLVTEKPDLADAIDSYARQNGVTDDLIDQLAPAASGDAVVVLTVAGHPPKAPRDPGMGPVQPPSAPTSPQTAGMSGMNGMARHGGGGLGNPAPMRPLAVDRNAYEMSASVFSLKDHKTTALINMGYSGQSADVALTKFVDKLKTQLAGFPCVGWNGGAEIDVKKIKELESQ